MEAEQIKCDAEPLDGHAIVYQKAPEMSAGGVVIPDNQRDKSARFFVVKSAAFFYDHGRAVEVNLEPGDEVVLKPNAIEKRLENGKEVQRHIIRSIPLPSGMLPDDCALVLLEDVAVRVPKAKVKSVLSKPGIELASPQLVKPGTH